VRLSNRPGNLHPADDAVKPLDRIVALGGLAIRPRALEDFLTLAATAGWQPEAVLEHPTNFNVRLGKR